MLTEAHANNLGTLKRAAANEDLAVVECQRVKDGATVVLLCAIGWDGEEYAITPFAEMIDGNPFELYRAPNPDGGFRG